MQPPPDQAELAATMLYWRTRQRERPPSDRIVVPGPGQESVWAYPRPPRISDEPRRIRIVFAGRTIVETCTAKRVVETAGAPVYYVPVPDVFEGVLVPTQDWSICEWKGVARYLDVVVQTRRAGRAAWHYPEPLNDLGQGYQVLRGHVAFYPSAMDACFIGTERVTPQPSEFYGGW